MNKSFLKKLTVALAVICTTSLCQSLPTISAANIHTPTKAELHKVFTIDASTLKTYAWVNDQQCTKPVKEIALDIQGLNAGHAYRTTPELQDTMLGAKGVLVVRPYSGPWNWMSFDTIKEIDKVLDAVYDYYGLSKDLPLVAFGRSMGGVGVLDYARYGKHKLTAAALNCPVTNLSYHCTERPDCASTIYRAYNSYKVPVEEAVLQHDPMQFVDKLPKITYFFVAGTADTAVHKNIHSDVYVPLMKAKGYDVTYLVVPGMTHVDLIHHQDALEQYANFIASFAK